MGEHNNQNDTERPAAFDGADRLAPLPEGMFCPQCDYDLRGLTSERCPECGFALAGVRSGESNIPWVQRAETGRLRAYWRTVALVTLRRKAFYAEFLRPVSYPDARSFRRMTILHLYVPLLIASIIALVYSWNEAVDTLGGLTIPTAIATQVALVLALLAMTAIPRYFLHPEYWPVEKQNRAIALSYYTSAVLLWFPIITALLGVGCLIWPSSSDALPMFLLLSAGVGGLVLLKWWFDVLSLARRALRARLWRLLLIVIGVPLAWVVVAGLLLVGIPGIVLYIGVIVSSLW
ncbi:MAG: hypothetical protein ABIG44_10330 [Planctomycetota bacterium]